MLVDRVCDLGLSFCYRGELNIVLRAEITVNVVKKQRKIVTTKTFHLKYEKKKQKKKPHMRLHSAKILS